MRSPYESYALVHTGPTIDVPDSSRPCFATFHEISTKRVVQLSSVEDFTALQAPSLNKLECQAQILFLNGHPSPQWLNAIGGRFCIDPEFYRRHLNFRAGISRPEYFTLPALPSASNTMARLRITTIGHRQPRLGLSASRRSQKHLDRLRAQATNDMLQYRNILGTENVWKTGDSIVREFTIHDEEHCTIEQDISICIDRVGQSWIGKYISEITVSHSLLIISIALIWLDVGADLEASPPGPWISSKRYNADNIEFLPTMQQRNKMALKNRHIPNTSNSNFKHGKGDLPQSASLLHLDYGRKLDSETAGTNPLYALSELFSFAATSELQFLNMMASKILREMDPTVLVQQANPSIANLLYSHRILDLHAERIEENIQFIEAQMRLSQSITPKAEVVYELLLKDFQALKSRSQTLSAQCDKGMTISMNNAAIKESQKAILQAEGVGRLTRLAFIFIPSSFTASLFGMNIRQFGTGANVELWLYFAITIPIMIVSILFLTVDISKYGKSFISRLTPQRKTRTNSFPL